MELFFPPHCVFCGRIIAPGTKVCGTCAGIISPVNALRCMNLPGSGENIPCAVLYFYEDQVRDSMIRFKFQGEKRNADYYAEQLAKLIRSRMQTFSFDLVTAVPISRERKKKRGYNQSELIARKIAGELGVPYEECLEKIYDNPEQHRLLRGERVKNVLEVYRAGTAETSGKKILLVDDIVTTGSTLSECTRILLNSGANTVVCAAVAQVSRTHG